VGVNGRLRGVLLQGGVSTGKTMRDNCDIVKSAPSSIGTVTANDGLDRGGNNPNGTFCHNETPFLTQVKANASYTLPWQEIQIAATYQDLPGPQILADATFARAQAAPSLGRNLSQSSTVNVPLVAPGALYGERMHQVDVRFAKTVRVGRTRVQGQFDIYNVSNANPVRAYTGTYGVTTGSDTGSAFLVPTAILAGRLLKFGAQVTF
jgi:hypothetical protein